MHSLRAMLAYYLSISFHLIDDNLLYYSFHSLVGAVVHECSGDPDLFKDLEAEALAGVYPSWLSRWELAL